MINKKLIVILTLAFILRLVNLNQSLWLDEAIQAMAIWQNSLKDLFLSYFPGDFNPPLGYLISWVTVRISGFSEIALRLPSVIFGVLNVWLVYLLADKVQPWGMPKLDLFEISFSELSALLLATAPLHIYYSQESRPYMLACLFATWSMYEFWRSLMPGVDPAKRGVDKETPGVNINWRYILSTTLMLYSHYMTWFLIPTQALIVLIKVRPWHMPRTDLFKNFLKNFLVSWFTIFLFLTPWLSIFLKQLKASRGIAESLPVWKNLGMFSFKNLSFIPVKFLIGRISVENNIVYGLVMLPILILATWLLIKSLSHITHHTSHASFLSLWLFLPLALGTIFSLRLPILQYFRFLFVLPAFYILLAYGILRTRSFKILILFFFIFNLACSSIYLFNPKFHREDWKGAVNFISQKNLNAPVLILKPISAPFQYYTGPACKSDQAGPALIDYQEAEKVRYLSQVWFIKYAQPIFDPENKTEKKLKDFGFEEITTRHFRGVEVKYMVNPGGLKAYSQMPQINKFQINLNPPAGG